MILSGKAIRDRIGSDIIIDPFDESQLNPNSYNLTLHDELMVYEELMLDMAKANRVRRIEIPAEGLVLSPNQLYLARTVERTTTHNLVPQIEGRSSVGRPPTGSAYALPPAAPPGSTECRTPCPSPGLLRQRLNRTVNIQNAQRG
jgi:hypothetical protein